MSFARAAYMAAMDASLNSLPDDFHALIFGAGGGIGGALAKALETRAGITALTRNDIDVTDEAALADLAAQLKNAPRFHLIVNATGLLHDAAQDITPEKAMRQIDGDKMARLFAVNAIAPALICKFFVPLMARDAKAVMAHLSARVGSISDNRLGGWTSYRAAKAAQNMIVKNAAIETARRDTQKVIIGLHPGTVDTRLSEPFQGNVAADKLFAPQQAAAHLLQVINMVTPADSGFVFAWDGQRIPA